MSYALIHTPAFSRSVRRLIRKQPALAPDIETTLEQLVTDPFAPKLKTHKLKGELKNSWACSAGYDLRIVFRFIRQKGRPAIALEALGTHDEVY